LQSEHVPHPTQTRADQDAAGRLPSFVWPELQEALLQEAELQEALLQEAELQEALLQEAELQEALLQEAELQEALFQEAFADAALDQEAASNTVPPFGSVVTYWSRPAFGFGGDATVLAAVACTSPTPSA
jgi:Pentapeptide repeats (8 copies)